MRSKFMFRYFLLIPVFFCFLYKLDAQPTNVFSGLVRSGDGKGLAGASVILSLIADSSIKQKTITDEAGKFSISGLREGRYTISIRLISYRTIEQPVTIKKGMNESPAFVLQPSAADLDAVVVTAQKPFLEQKTDRTVINVQAMPSNAGANVLEVLERLPGVTVDQNGTISFKGKTGIVVLIDDKPTYLSGDALANYLRSLPASQLDQIELIPNPPAKYDASGNAGMINIKNKKITIKGFNGTFTSSLGVNRVGYVRPLTSIAMNYRVNKINVFGNFGYSLINNYRELIVTRAYSDPSGQPLSGYTETAHFHPMYPGFNGKAGIDYSVSPKTGLSMTLTGATSSGNNRNNTRSDITSKTGTLDSTILANNVFNPSFTNSSINLNWTQQFRKKGENLSVDLDHLRYDNFTDQDFRNNTYSNSGMLTYGDTVQSHLPTLIRIWTAKSDFVYPLSNHGKWESGVKYANVNTDNTANYYNVLGGARHIDYGRSNRFLYEENVFAAYTGYSAEWKRISVKAGLRMENTTVKAHQLGNVLQPDSAFTQHYADLFPTAYFTYKLDSAGSNTLNLSYGRRIDRPYYQNLNPFVTYVDKYSTWVGNPYLKPQYVDNYQLVYSYKSLFSFTVAYAYIHDFQSEVDLQEGNLFVAHTYNLDHGIQTSASVYLSLPVTKWWTFQLNSDLIRNSFSGVTQGIEIKSAMTRMNSNITNRFTFSKTWSAEFSGFYNTSGVYGQFHSIPQGQAVMGIAKKIWKDKATIRLSVRDIFNTNVSGGRIEGIPGVAATYHNDFANQQVSIGFSYNFGSDANVKKKTDSGGASSERSRAGG